VRRVPWLLRLILFFSAIYLFLVAVSLFEQAAQVCGKGAAENLLEGLRNPFAGLAVGVLATVLVQSSSLTTSLIVGLVGSGELALDYAVPMVMGANIGTSITNTLISLGHLTRNSAFRRAFAGATVHDFFNLLSVLIFFPLELATGLLRHTAEWLQHLVSGLAERLLGPGGTCQSPVKMAVKCSSGAIKAFFSDTCGLQNAALAAVLFAAALLIVVGALVLITKNMRLLMADRIEAWLNRVLRRSGLLGFGIGIAITALVQSSSITTSLLVPMFGAGVLALEAGFPIMVGANIGTTITALLAAAAVTQPAGLTIALVHLLFNACGTLVLFAIKPMRRIPIFLARQLANLAVRNRVWVVVYILGVFFLLPILGILIWK
jgi:sodium-dependent phosphate cotransporter